MPRALKELESAAPFGAWLRRARTDRGLTLEGLADKADVSQPTISNLERGVRNPSRNMVERLALALVPDGLETDEAQEAFRRLYNEGIRTAFPTEGADEDPTDPIESIVYEAGASEGLTESEVAQLRAEMRERLEIEARIRAERIRRARDRKG